MSCLRVKNPWRSCFCPASVLLEGLKLKRKVPVYRKFTQKNAISSCFWQFFEHLEWPEELIYDTNNHTSSQTTYKLSLKTFLKIILSFVLCNEWKNELLMKKIEKTAFFWLFQANISKINPPDAKKCILGQTKILGYTQEYQKKFQKISDDKTLSIFLKNFWYFMNFSKIYAIFAVFGDFCAIQNGRRAQYRSFIFFTHFKQSKNYFKK